MAKREIYIFMGVSGSGKTTIGKAFAKAKGLTFFDADDFHSDENKQKMAAGQPLDDEDRIPWLYELDAFLNYDRHETGIVLACSALKESYRVILSEDNPQVKWKILHSDFDTIISRLDAREGHFMKAGMLESQFEALELPDYGQHLDVKLSIPDILKELLAWEDKPKSTGDLGLIGLGVMGKSLALNMTDHGFNLSVYNRVSAGEEHIVPDFMSKNEDNEKLRGFTDLKGFITSLKSPKKVFLMVKAGAVVDAVIEQVRPLLSEGDMIMDGGNSYFLDTKRRSESLKKQGIQYLGVGVSGGETGARFGPSIMPGGDKEAYEKVQPILESIAARDKNGGACCTYIGADGAGHFVKMVHNGIEYAEMQLLAEVVSLLRLEHDYETVAAILNEWNQGILKSYLLEITAKILLVKEGETHLVDLILDKAGNKGTGSWSSQLALKLGLPTTMMTAAVFARYMSAFKESRVKWAHKSPKLGHSINIDALKNAYRAAQLCNHQQGFALISGAANEYNWELNFSEIARIWTNGCIIRSAFMQGCIGYFNQKNNLMDVPEIYADLEKNESGLEKTIQIAMSWRAPTPCFSAAWNYWTSMTSSRLSANIIQAQRDFFGAHTYQRVDAPGGEAFHTEWER